MIGILSECVMIMGSFPKKNELSVEAERRAPIGIVDDFGIVGKVERFFPACRFATSIIHSFACFLCLETWICLHPQSLTHLSPWKMMVGRWSFPFGFRPIFRGYVKLREGKFKVIFLRICTMVNHHQNSKPPFGRIVLELFPGMEHANSRHGTCKFQAWNMQIVAVFIWIMRGMNPDS